MGETCAGGIIPDQSTKYPIVDSPMGRSKYSFSSEGNAEAAIWQLQTFRSCHFIPSVLSLSL
jgi:hypothetical protein